MAVSLHNTRRWARSHACAVSPRDAGLIALATELRDAELAYIAAGVDEVDVSPSLSLIARVAEMPAATLAGVAAKAAHLAWTLADDRDQQVGHDALARSIVADLRRLLPNVVPVEGPDSAAPHPDAEIIAACEQYPAVTAAYNAGSDNDPDSDALWAAYEVVRDAISDAEPQTLAGMLAKARASKYEALAGGLVGHEDPHSTMAEEWSWDLVNDLLRLFGGEARA